MQRDRDPGWSKEGDRDLPHVQGGSYPEGVVLFLNMRQVLLLFRGWSHLKLCSCST